MTMTLPMPRAAAAALLLEVLGALAVLYFVGSQVKEVVQLPLVTRVTLQSAEVPPVLKLPDPPMPKPVPVHKISQTEPVQPVKQEASHEAENKALPVHNDPPPKMIQQATVMPTPPVTPEVSMSFQSRGGGAVDGDVGD